MMGMDESFANDVADSTEHALVIYQNKQLQYARVCVCLQEGNVFRNVYEK